MRAVYGQAAPDVFEGVAVELGPRLVVKGEPTAYYPVLRGLEAGDQVVTNGSFLIDAETRLNPAAGSVYFGGSAGKGAPSGVAVRPSTPQDEDALERKARPELAKLNAADRRGAGPPVGRGPAVLPGPPEESAGLDGRARQDHRRGPACLSLLRQLRGESQGQPAADAGDGRAAEEGQRQQDSPPSAGAG